MLEKSNEVIKGSDNLPILIDWVLPDNNNNNNNKVVIFSHGFKGFKDWGPFNEIAEYFAKNNFIFVKFNFSYNGTSIDDPCNFVNLDAFGNNNFCKEIDDLSLVIDWVEGKFANTQIILFGHSRGGAISILKAVADDRISHVVSWASPSDLLAKLPTYEKLKKWAETDVAYIYNGRTKQNMPLYYQFYTNCLENAQRLSIENAVMRMNKPHLHVHGDADSTVPVDEAYSLKNWNPDIFLHVINSADHVFDGFHPYNLYSFPEDLKEAIDVTLNFLKS
tara:strand:- start:35222 stop:36052 length:831 start_codon:yes stop_codon:yes gene_type:complete